MVHSQAYRLGTGPSVGNSRQPLCVCVLVYCVAWAAFICWSGRGNRCAITPVRCSVLLSKRERRRCTWHACSLGLGESRHSSGGLTALFPLQNKPMGKSSICKKKSRLSRVEPPLPPGCVHVSKMLLSSVRPCENTPTNTARPPPRRHRSERGSQRMPFPH